MDGMIKFDYYYGIEAEQFSFYRFRRLLIRRKGLKSCPAMQSSLWSDA